MNKFICNVCQYTFEGKTPPEKCPSCGSSCSFIDATCYTPDCGNGNNINTVIYKNPKQ
ncbi:MAG: hypothetical protein P4L69_09250 [Desulfosporosinus sp.]|nr:hypothetical protein [Desulfosporosinus sp.]